MTSRVVHLARSTRAQRNLRIVMGVLGLAIVTRGLDHPARAVPAFAQQTGQPCATCHVGAFGPQLKPYGRDFKLRAFTATDGAPWRPPIAVTVQTSLTHTESDQTGGAARWFAPNNNVALDQVSIYYAGRIAPNLGAFIQGTYDGVARVVAIDNTDIRYAREFEAFGVEGIAGVTLNNSPTVSDLWNSTPVWGFPYNGSALAPVPVASALIDGQPGQRVIGSGAYGLFADWIYTEFDLYRGLGRDVLNATGIVPVSGAPKIDGLVPYWRVALQHDFDRHSFEAGGYGMHANIFPGGDTSAGRTDTYDDAALDANYQFIVNPKSVLSDMLSAHATLIHERQALNASQILTGSNGNNSLNTFRIDASYSFGATITPTIQYFHTWGSPDANFYGLPNGSPNSAGFISEIAYVPFGKPNSPIQWGNLRLALQYVTYTEFNGTSHGASKNNAIYLSLWLASHF